MQENYAAGTTSILDLLDAQAQQRIQEQNSQLAIIQFFRDLLAYQRSISWFEFLNDAIQKEKWITEWNGFHQP